MATPRPHAGVPGAPPSGAVSDRSVDAAPAGTLERGLHLLSLFSADKPEWTLRELREHSQLAKATLRRLMLTLQRLGWVDYAADRSAFTLGPRIVQALYAKTSTTMLVSHARPHLERLAHSTTESAHLAAWGHDGAITLDLVSTPRHFKPLTSIGTVMPGLDTADAQVLTAFSPETVWNERLEAFASHTRRLDQAEQDRLRTLWQTVRAAGVAYDREGWRPGVCAAAAPVLDPTGRPLASVSVIVPSERGGGRELRQHADALTHAAAGIARAIRGDVEPVE